MGGGVGRGAGEEAGERRPQGRSGRGGRGFGGDLRGDAPLQDQLGQATGRGGGEATGREGVAQAEPAGRHWGAGTRPHGAGGVAPRRLGLVTVRQGDRQRKGETERQTERYNMKVTTLIGPNSVLLPSETISNKHLGLESKLDE